jgi:hypothetical protein
METLTLIITHIGFALWFYLGYRIGRQFKNK